MILRKIYKKKEKVRNFSATHSPLAYSSSIFNL